MNNFNDTITPSVMNDTSEQVNFKSREFDAATSTVNQLKEYSAKLSRETIKFDNMERKLKTELIELTKNMDTTKNEVCGCVVKTLCSMFLS